MSFISKSGFSDCRYTQLLLPPNAIFSGVFFKVSIKNIALHVGYLV